MTKNIFFLFFFLFSSNLLFSQIDTVEQKKNFIMKMFDAKDAAVILAPVISRSPDTRLNFSLDFLRYFKSNKNDTNSVRTSHISAFVDYSLNNQFKIGGNWLIFFNEDKLQSRGSIYFSDFPDVFYGVGNRSNKEDIESYSYSKVKMNGNILKELGAKSFYLGGALRYHNYFNKDIDRAPLLNELNNLSPIQNEMMGVGVEFNIDKRDNFFYSKKGYFFSFSSMYHIPIFENFREFTQTNIKFNKYFNIKNSQVIAFQFQSDFNFGEDIPFFELHAAGGSRILRSYATNRYRDRNFIGTQVEYRFPLIWRLRGAVFTGVGEVFNQPNQVRMDYLKYSYGGGVRFVINKANMLQVRLDYGRGLGNSNVIYLGFGEAF